MTSGAQAELCALNVLQQKGLTVVAQNFHCRFGEIDLIMQDTNELVFIEVRLRSNSGFGGAAASIDIHKQKRLIRTAQYYLAGLPRTPPCRFDAVLMDDTSGRNLQWIRNAFEA